MVLVFCFPDWKTSLRFFVIGSIQEKMVYGNSYGEEDDKTELISSLSAFKTSPC